MLLSIHHGALDFIVPTLGRSCGKGQLSQIIFLNNEKLETKITYVVSFIVYVSQDRWSNLLSISSNQEFLWYSH